MRSSELSGPTPPPPPPLDANTGRLRDSWREWGSASSLVPPALGRETLTMPQDQIWLHRALGWSRLCDACFCLPSKAPEPHSPPSNREGTEREQSGVVAAGRKISGGEVQKSKKKKKKNDINICTYTEWKLAGIILMRTHSAGPDTSFLIWTLFESLVSSAAAFFKKRKKKKGTHSQQTDRAWAHVCPRRTARHFVDKR